MKHILSLPGVLLIGLFIRLIWAAFIPVDPVSDTAAYDTFARNIAFHGVYGFTPEAPGAYWAVGPAAIYAGAYLIFGAGALAIVTVNLISSLLVIAGLWDLGHRWFGARAGQLAALMFALWPLAIQYITFPASELHFMALTLLALMAWDRASAPASGRFWIWALLAGVALAGATYVRPIALLIPAALALASLLRGQWLAPLLKAGLATVVILACVAPWSARNEAIFGERVFMSTNFWANFWMGNHEGTTGAFTPLPDEVLGMSEVERAAHMKQLSLAELERAPLEFVWRTLWKAVRLHERETIGVVWNEGGIRTLGGDAAVTGLKALSTGWWYLMLGLAVWGVVVLARWKGLWRTLLSPPVWLWLYFTGIHAVIVVGDRYHMPAIPMIALLAGVGAASLSGVRDASPPEASADRVR